MQPALNVFITVTLKQARPADDGRLYYMTSDLQRSTAFILRDRVTASLVGKKRKDTIPFLVFGEGDGIAKRHHLHILTVIPPDVPFEDYSAMFREKALRLDWVYNEIDVRLIRPGTDRVLIKYSLKEGLDAFIPEASFVPPIR